MCFACVFQILPTKAHIEQLLAYLIHVFYMCFLVPHVFCICILNIWARKGPYRRTFELSPTCVLNVCLICAFVSHLFDRRIPNMGPKESYCIAFALSPTCVPNVFYMCFVAPHLFRMYFTCDLHLFLRFAFDQHVFLHSFCICISDMAQNGEYCGTPDSSSSCVLHLFLSSTCVSHAVYMCFTFVS